MSKRNENRQGYKKTKSGWIPEEWECVHIRDVTNVVTGTTPSTKNSEYYGDEFLFVGPGDLGNRKYIVSSSKKISRKGFNKCRKIPAGSTLFTCIGSTIGKLAIAGKELATNQQINAVLSKKKESKEFLYYALLKIAPKIKALASEQAVPIVNKSEFSAYNIPLPPLPEQKKIAEILSVWDQAIEQVDKLIDSKQWLKKGLMQQLLTGRMRFSEFVKTTKKYNTRYGAVPADWKYPKVNEIADEVSNRNTDRKNICVLSCTKHDGLVESLKYFGRQVFSNDTSTYKVVKRSQFAYATNHIEEGSIGMLDFLDEGLVSPMYTVFKTRDRLHAPFLYKIFKTELYRHIFEVNTSASINRRGSLRWNKFALIHIPLPFFDEQKKIGAVFNILDKEIDLLKNRLRILKKQKRGLMQKLLTGEVRVK